MLSADLVERDIGDTEFLGEMDHGFRPDEVVELAAGEAQARQFPSVDFVVCAPLAFRHCFASKSFVPRFPTFRICGIKPARSAQISMTRYSSNCSFSMRPRAFLEPNGSPL